MEEKREGDSEGKREGGGREGVRDGRMGGIIVRGKCSGGRG